MEFVADQPGRFARTGFQARLEFLDVTIADGSAKTTDRSRADPGLFSQACAGLERDLSKVGKQIARYAPFDLGCRISTGRQPSNQLGGTIFGSFADKFKQCYTPLERKVSECERLVNIERKLST
jgi:hypothetical protein